MSKYVLPNFTIYKPQYLEYSIKEIKKSFLYKDNYEKQPDKNKYQNSLFKLINNETLAIRDFKVLSYYLISLEELELFDQFYEIFILKINQLRNKNYFIKPFLSYVYNGYKNRQRVFATIKALIKLITKKKEKYKEVFRLVDSSSSSDIFIDNIKNRFSKVRNYNEIQSISAELLIRSTDEIYSECIIEFIFANYIIQDLWDSHKKNVQMMKLELKKGLLKRILQVYKDNLQIETYPNQWFNLIYRELGDPFDPINYKWKGLEDEKEIFRRWNIGENLEQFFEQIVGGDKRRKNFWKRYMNNIYRIEYFQELSQSLVMEFKSHLFIEFAKEGNACYFYDKNQLNINDIKGKLRNSSMTRSEKIRYLKQGENKRSHSGRWEYQFDYILRYLGYEKSRWY